jgi:integrase
MCGLRRSKVLGLTWDCVDLDRGEIVVQAGRVLLDGRRTATDDPKSAASRRTVPVEEIQPGTVALLRSLRARQAADRLVLGGWVPGDRSVARRRAGDTCQARGAYSDRFAGVVPYG